MFHNNLQKYAIKTGKIDSIVFFSFLDPRNISINCRQITSLKKTRKYQAILVISVYKLSQQDLDTFCFPFFSSLIYNDLLSS